ncbi:MAG: aminopeptidase P family protein [Actinomycetota bacterium]|nr:aminopeptidase P family protein [Actinomycetota bacterium]
MKSSTLGGVHVSDRFQPATYPVPASDALVSFMRDGWADGHDVVERLGVATWAQDRRVKLSQRFPGDRLVIPAGPLKPRANDTDYRFRADTAHVYFSGNQTSDAVLVIDDGEPTLFFRPRHAKSDDAFWRDGRYGEAWAGRRLSLAEASEVYGVTCRHLYELPDVLRSGGPTRVHRGVDPDVDAMVDKHQDPTADQALAVTMSEMRLTKDDWEVAQLQDAVDSTICGFEDSVREWSNVLRYGERWLEGTFWRRARANGNDVGYESIVAGGRHATTLHWIENDGAVEPGKLILLDMGVENRSLYTADVTRTLPISGTFTSEQRDLYDLVYAAQEAGMAAVKPGVPYRDFHTAAMTVLAHGLEEMGILPVSAAEALEKDSGVYRRWTLHGTGHMLGLDVHDCAAARNEGYLDGKLEPGMVLTVEPGLYFQESDLLVPESLRGIGIRIEDDLLVTEDGARNLSAGLARTADDVEAWMGALSEPQRP